MDTIPGFNRVLTFVIYLFMIIILILCLGLLYIRWYHLESIVVQSSSVLFYSTYYVKLNPISVKKIDIVSNWANMKLKYSLNIFKPAYQLHRDSSCERIIHLNWFEMRRILYNIFNYLLSMYRKVDYNTYMTGSLNKMLYSYILAILYI